MELVELLDSIDTTAPRSCQTCRHMATHAGCHNPGEPNYCLGPYIYGQHDYPYTNWEPGNWLRDIDAAERAGARNIVIGGTGEADFAATDRPDQVSKHLHYVAEQCGYFVGKLTRTPDGGYRLNVTTEETHTVVWNATGQLVRIENATTQEREWPRF